MHYIEIQILSVFLLPDAIGSQQQFCLKSCSFTIKKLKLFPGVTYIPKEISYRHQQGAPDALLVNNFKHLNKRTGYTYSRNSALPSNKLPGQKSLKFLDEILGETMTS